MTAQLQLRPMVRSGGRNSRKDAICRTRSGTLLMLCLSAAKAAQAGHDPACMVELAVVASKKQVSKKATVRNRVKRRIRNAALVLQRAGGTDVLPPGYDLSLQIIIVSHRDMQQCPFEVLQKQILTAFKKLLDDLSKT